MNERLLPNKLEQTILLALNKIILGETAWEGSANVMTFNGEPVGGTVRPGLQIDRWWCDELKFKLAKLIAESITIPSPPGGDAEISEVLKELKGEKSWE